MFRSLTDSAGPSHYEYSDFEALSSSNPVEPGSVALVFGASGFVGRYTSVLLHALGVKVVGAVRSLGAGFPTQPGVGSWVKADIRNREAVAGAVAKTGPSVVINCARAGFARAETDTKTMWAVNYGGVRSIIEALTDAPGARLVQVGSSTEYGPSSRPLSENSPKVPVGEFGRTKSEASELVVDWAKRHQRAAAIIRPFKIYGLGEHISRFLPTLFWAATQGKPIALVENSRRDYVHVWDVASAILRCIPFASPLVPQLNVGTGVSFCPREVVEQFQKVSGVRVDVSTASLPPDPIDSPEWRASTAGIRANLGWSPSITLSEGLRSWWERLC